MAANRNIAAKAQKSAARWARALAGFRTAEAPFYAAWSHLESAGDDAAAEAEVSRTAKIEQAAYRKLRDTLAPDLEALALKIAIVMERGDHEDGLAAVQADVQCHAGAGLMAARRKSAPRRDPLLPRTRD